MAGWKGIPPSTRKQTLGAWSRELTKKSSAWRSALCKRHFPDLNCDSISLFPSKVILRKIIIRNLKPWDNHSQHHFGITNYQKTVTFSLFAFPANILKTASPSLHPGPCLPRDQLHAPSALLQWPRARTRALFAVGSQSEILSPLTLDTSLSVSLGWDCAVTMQLGAAGGRGQEKHSTKLARLSLVGSCFFSSAAALSELQCYIKFIHFLSDGA